MKKIKNFARMLVLGLFVLGSAFSFAAVQAQSADPVVTSADTTYPAGSLLSLEDLEGAAVYLIGNDGMKYVFPDEKTYMTWYENFGEVIKVDQATLDSYPDGGTVPFRAGVKLLTHPCTAKVYAVGDDGEVVHIPDESTALQFYGNNWKEFIQDVDCGMFAVSYKVRNGFLSDDNLPNGTLTQDEDSDELFYIDNGKRRLVTAKALKLNNFLKKVVVKAKVKTKYQEGEHVEYEEEYELEYDPTARGKEKAFVCHKGETIRIAKPALRAHLAHGDTQGRCSNTEDDDEDDDEDDNDYAYPVCDHNGDGVRNLSDLAMFAQCQGTYDVNGDGVHNLIDYSSYAQNNQSDTWCAANFVCNPNEDEEPSLAVCDHNEDGVVNLSDVSLFSACETSFDVNGDGEHDLTDVSLYAQNYSNTTWCITNFVCDPDEEEEVAVCGNGIVEDEEECDDGNLVGEYCGDESVQSGTYCSADCKEVLTLDEECDEGENGSEECTNQCTVPEGLAVCDHNEDGVRDLLDWGIFGGCSETFDVNGDGEHDLTDVSAYASNYSDDGWCATNFVCEPEDNDNSSTTTEYTPTEN